MLRIIFGGTFNPIHWGHIRPALALADELSAPAIHLMPSAIPPHRQTPAVSAEQRLQMVRLACELDPRLQAEDWELQQDRHSYTAITLAELKQQYPQDTLVFALGMDAFNALDTWHQWQQLVDHAHLVVMRRGNTQRHLKPVLNAFVTARELELGALHQQVAGGIYFAQTPLIDISATEIRQRIKKHNDRWTDMVPAAIADYIKQQQLYR
ncbi:MAG: nicotinate-nucleotide adenylyltransferase [Idiomarina sp.]